LRGGVVNNQEIFGSVDRSIVLNYGRLVCRSNTVVRLADLSVALGFHVGQHENFINIGAKFSFPTGNLANAKYLFEPIFGRGGYYGIGGECFGNVVLWEHEAKVRRVKVLWQSELLHLIPGRDQNFRSFDLKKNGPGSRYLLLQKYIPTNTSYVANVLIPAINITTFPVVSKINLEGSFACSLSIDFDCITVGFGSEFWGRSHEKLSIDFDESLSKGCVRLSDYAVLGRQISKNYGVSPCKSLSCCEPLAQINKSQKRIVCLVDRPEGIVCAKDIDHRIPPGIDALDIAGAQVPRMMSEKLFAFIGYGWSHCSYQPNISLFSSVERMMFEVGNIYAWSIGLQGTLKF